MNMHAANPRNPDQRDPAGINASSRFHRRDFLKTALGAGALWMSPQIVSAATLGRGGAVAPNDRVMLGAIGIGNRGGYVLNVFLQAPDVQFIAVCDVKANRRDAVKKMADDKYGNQNCATYRDLRELLTRDDLDAVLIATGPNWHAAASALAAEAGKDVYCEKPCTKNIAESLALAKTFRRTGRVFQAGTQRRSLPNFMFAIDLARYGKLGKLHTLHAHPGGLGGPRPAAGRNRRRNRPGTRWTGTFISGHRPGARSTASSSTGSISKKAAAWSAAAASSGDRIVSTCASGPRPLCQWRSTHPAQRRLAAPRFLPRPL
jgi:predicted dehydrogenase